MKNYISLLPLSLLSLASISCSAQDVKTSAQTKPPVTLTQNSSAQTKAPAPSTQSPENAPVEKRVAVPLIQPRGEWIDWPIQKGDWRYRQDERGSIALFGLEGRDAKLILRCMKNSKQIFLSRLWRIGEARGNIKMTIRTSHTLKSYTAAPTGGTPAYVAIEIDRNDDILDALAYTRGRFAIETTGLFSRAIPSWSEIVRVVEDCR